MDLSDAELVERTRDGDPRAFEQLIRRHLRAAYSVALAALMDPSDADDVCQEAYITALQKIDRLQKPEKFKAWLLQIVRNRAIDFRRSGESRSGVPLESVRELTGTHDSARDADRSALRDRLTLALGTLPSREREVVLLHDLEGWRHREIGEKLGIPEGTVRYLLSKARQALRDELHEGLLERP